MTVSDSNQNNSESLQHPRLVAAMAAAVIVAFAVIIVTLMVAGGANFGEIAGMFLGR